LTDVLITATIRSSVGRVRKIGFPDLDARHHYLAKPRERAPRRHRGRDRALGKEFDEGLGFGFGNPR